MKIELIVLVILSATVSMFTLSAIIGGAASLVLEKTYVQECGSMILHEQSHEVIVPDKCLELFEESREEIEKIKRR